MKWNRKKARKSDDVVDIRGASPPSRGGGGTGGLPIPGSVAGLGGGAGVVVLIVVIAIQVFGGGGDSGGGFSIDDVLGGGSPAPGAEDPAPLPEDQDPDRELRDFSAYVVTDAQDTWTEIFQQQGREYERAELVLYTQAVRTGGCGSATSAVGPFYCPADQRVYLDLSFYEAMRRQLGAPGDFAWAYVIAHEVGHHIQNLLGTNSEVAELERDNPDDANELSVRLELQADCYSGIWASTVFDQLEQGDLDEAFAASEAVGDDRLQEQAGGDVDPDSFTHGTSEQRRRWFEAGYKGGDPGACDTFSTDDL